MTRQTFIQENDWWVFFGYGEGWPKDKCSRCMQLIDTKKEPNEHCINCWKLEIFFSNCTDLDRMKEYLMQEAKKDPTLSGKWLKKSTEMLSQMKDKMTSIPEEGHPDPRVKEDGVILIYNQSIEERQRRAEHFQKAFKEKGLYKKDILSYRRGCLNFDMIIGPWKAWHALDQDYNKARGSMP